MLSYSLQSISHSVEGVTEQKDWYSNVNFAGITMILSTT